MLFTKRIEPRCAYCAKGTALNDETVACRKRGVTPAGSSCRGFRYDPLKRVPPKPVSPDFSKLKDEDFVL